MHGVRPSLRLYCNKALPIYRGWQAGESHHHWKDRLKTVVIRRAVCPVHIATREDKRESLRTLAKECWDDGRTSIERKELWELRTGKTWRTGYRYWQELGLVR